MGVIADLEDVLGWVNNRGQVLCPDCFEEEAEDRFSPDYEPILEEEQPTKVYECDICKERFLG